MPRKNYLYLCNFMTLIISLPKIFELYVSLYISIIVHVFTSKAFCMTSLSSLSRNNTSPERQPWS